MTDSWLNTTNPVGPLTKLWLLVMEVRKFCKINEQTFPLHMIPFWGYGFLIFPACYSGKAMFGKFSDIFSDS